MKFTLKSLLLAATLTVGIFYSGCESVYQIADAYATPTNAEISAGLRDALGKGVGTAVNMLGQEGGYLNNPAVRIPFPPEAERVANTLRDLGAGQLVDDFVTRLNRGAEEGAKEALPIFTRAIRQMSFADVRDILLGNNPTAATDYFKRTTRQSLYSLYTPKIRTVLNEVGAARLWTDVTTRYNAIPLVKDVETDLVGYATNRALDGLFLMVAEEEQKIRANPVARTTEIMKKVFGWADRQ